MLCALAHRLSRARQASIPRSMSSDTPYARAFRRAIETLGSAEELAGAVGASVKEVEAWAAGLAHPPFVAFQKAIDIIARGWAPGAR